MTKRDWIVAAFCSLLVFVAGTVQAADAPSANAPKEGETEGQSVTEINKKLTNPVSDLWSVTLQQNNYRIDTGIPGKGDYWSSNLDGGNTRSEGNESSGYRQKQGARNL